MDVKKNFLFSTVLTVSNYIFPFIVYPYVARVLGVNNIGICNFVENIVNFAIMLSMLGMSIVGVREIAKAKNDPLKLDRTFTALMTVCTVFTVLSTIVLVIVTFTVPMLFPYRKMLFISIIRLWSTFLLIDWFYRGMEDFKYITIRTILVKIAFIVCVFAFIHKPEQYFLYYTLLCLSVTANAFFNCFRAFRRIRLRFSWPYTRQVIRPLLTLGFYLFLNSLYTTLNVVYLGFVCGDTEVGYYTTSTKIFFIIMAVYTAYSGVVMPRASALLAENKTEEFRQLIGKSMQALILIAVPIVVAGMLFSSGIIDLIAGGQYIGAIVPMMIVMPLVFIIGYEQILVVQILTPMAKDRIILFNAIVGASVGILGNIILVKPFGAIGSSVVWVSAEIAVLLSAQYFVTRSTGIRFPVKSLTVNVASYLPFILASLLAIHFIDIDPVMMMFIGGGVCFVYFMILQRYFLKNEIFTSLFASLANKIPIIRK